MDKHILLALERKTHKLLVRFFELANGSSDLMITFGDAIRGWDWTDKECDQVEDYATGERYIKRMSGGDTKIASFLLTQRGRRLAKELILKEPKDNESNQSEAVNKTSDEATSVNWGNRPVIGNLLVPNDRPWEASGDPYTGGTTVKDAVTGEVWQPASPATISDYGAIRGVTEQPLVTVNVTHTSGILQPGTYHVDPTIAHVIRLADAANEIVAGLRVDKAAETPIRASDTPTQPIDGVASNEDLPEWLKKHVPSNYWQIIQLWNKGYTYKDIGTRVSLTSGRVGNIISEQRNRLTVVYGKEKAGEYIKYHRSIKSRKQQRDIGT